MSWAYTDKVRRYEFDPGHAKTLLDSAGWRDSDGDGIRDQGGKPLSFTLITQAGYAIRENVAQAIQRQLRDVGIDAKVQLIDGTALSSLWFEGRFDAMLHWWQMAADPELTLTFASDRVPPAGRNIDYLQDDSLTAVLYASDRTIDEEKRRALLQDAQRRIAELAPEIPLYNVTRLDAVPTTLRNFKGNPTNTGIFWNVHEWEIGTTTVVAAP
jgi:peptide/nickel transport system substrate-binding protein